MPQLRHAQLLRRAWNSPRSSPQHLPLAQSIAPRRINRARQNTLLAGTSSVSSCAWAGPDAAAIGAPDGADKTACAVRGRVLDPPRGRRRQYARLQDAECVETCGGKRTASPTRDATHEGARREHVRLATSVQHTSRSQGHAARTRITHDPAAARHTRPSRCAVCASKQPRAAH